MGYIHDFRAKLRQLIEEGKTEDALQYAADTVLTSYRNGEQVDKGRETHEEKPSTFRQQYKSKTPASNRRSYK